MGQIPLKFCFWSFFLNFIFRVNFNILMVILMIFYIFFRFFIIVLKNSIFFKILIFSDFEHVRCQFGSILIFFLTFSKILEIKIFFYKIIFFKQYMYIVNVYVARNSKELMLQGTPWNFQGTPWSL